MLLSIQLFSQTEEGLGTFYNDKYHGRSTSSGEIYNKFKYTAAHRTLPFGTWVMVTNLTNNRSVRVRINDRGPYTKGRIIDLSRTAAEQLDMLRTGEVRVRVDVISVGGTLGNPVASGGGFSPAVSPRSRKSNVDISNLPVVDINGNPINPDAEPVYDDQAYGDDPAYYGLKPEPKEEVGYAPASEAQKYTPSLFRMIAFKEESIGYGVQVGAYFNFYRLLEGMDKLSAKGYQNTLVQSGMKDGKAVFRIVVGPYATKAEADKMRRRLKSAKLDGITVDLATLK